MRHLTAGQHALLETALQQQLLQLDRRRAEHLGGSTRAEHAHRVLQQDGDDAPQREAEIPFDRLKAEPWALRCLPCQAAREKARRPPHG